MFSSLCILDGAWKPGRHSLVGEKSIQAHYHESGALPSHQGGHAGGQPISGSFTLADHNGHPFGPVQDDKIVGEPIKELIHKAAHRPLDVDEVIPGVLTLRVVFIDNFEVACVNRPWIYSIILKPKLHFFLQSGHLNPYMHHYFLAQTQPMHCREI